MNNIKPEYTFDDAGNTVGVFLPIEDWNIIAEELHYDIPEWQKKIVIERLKTCRENPSSMIDWEIFAAEELDENA
ncbi:MAG: hypothetical protein LBE82_10535 [Chitinophagaceae bacterium]|jgi:hypothetical protein|nr:hypothetical protein [Chitinophagaceae bacterium]